METALWIAQVLLALLFAAAGAIKLVRPREALLEQMAWVEDFSPRSIKVIGGIEILGALGLILPAVTGIAPMLVPLAAGGLAITQVAAAIVHMRRGETANIIGNVVLIALAAFVAWGRFGDYPL